MMKFDCPKCAAPLSIAINHAQGETVSMRLVPVSGGLLNASVAGRKITHFARLFEACAKESGVKTEAILRGLSMDEEGAMTVEIELVPVVTTATQHGAPANG